MKEFQSETKLSIIIIFYRFVDWRHVLNDGVVFEKQVYFFFRNVYDCSNFYWFYQIIVCGCVFARGVVTFSSVAAFLRICIQNDIFCIGLFNLFSGIDLVKGNGRGRIKKGIESISISMALFKTYVRLF
jgi:hypothetical protein